MAPAILLFCFLGVIFFTDGLKLPQRTWKTQNKASQTIHDPPKLAMTSGIDSFTMLTSILQRVEPSQAKGEFFFFFFGGSGALGIGLAQLPKLIGEWNRIQDLKDGPTLGGEEMSLSPIATIGYPESVKTSDIQKIIDEMPPVQTIVDNGPKRNYFATLGYIEREGFVNSFDDKTNPVALQAAFDALGKGGGEMANPTDFQTIFDGWKESGLDGFKSDLLSAQLRKYSAYFVFFFLIALVLDLVVESGTNAFL